MINVNLWSLYNSRMTIFRECHIQYAQGNAEIRNVLNIRLKTPITKQNSSRFTFSGTFFLPITFVALITSSEVPGIIVAMGVGGGSFLIIVVTKSTIFTATCWKSILAKELNPNWQHSVEVTDHVELTWKTTVSWISGTWKLRKGFLKVYVKRRLKQNENLVETHRIRMDTFGHGHSVFICWYLHLLMISVTK